MKSIVLIIIMFFLAIVNVTIGMFNIIMCFYIMGIFNLCIGLCCIYTAYILEINKQS